MAEEEPQEHPTPESGAGFLAAAFIYCAGPGMEAFAADHLGNLGPDRGPKVELLLLIDLVVIQWLHLGSLMAHGPKVERQQGSFGAAVETICEATISNGAGLPTDTIRELWWAAIDAYHSEPARDIETVFEERLQRWIGEENIIWIYPLLRNPATIQMLGTIDWGSSLDYFAPDSKP